MVTTNPASATIFRKEPNETSTRTGDVRYLFVGKNKQTGEPVDGHIDADSEAGVVKNLADQGIVATKVKLDPRQSKQEADLPATAPKAANAFVPRPAADRRDEDKVVVMDRDKIRRNVAAALDHALAMSFARNDGPMQIRARVANAIHGLFKDYRNITSEAPVDHSGAMEEQLGKLQDVIARTEKMLTSWSKYGPPRGGGGGGEGGGKRRSSKMKREGPDEVLREIFQANLQLMKSIEAGLSQNKT
ncbi:MAG TPA: hypothetical protein VK968_13775 [Roseimicrobium sp.]|nr:hypothetical protein [Roseimicrobium sp.]